jgi:hypothetical protein
MKTFNQFLNESYFSEAEVQGKLLTSKGTAQDFRNPKKTPFTGTDPTAVPASRRLSAAGPKGTGTKVSPGQMEIPKTPTGTTTRVPGSGVRGSEKMSQGSLLTRSGGAQNFTGGKTPFVSTEPVKTTKRLSAVAPEAPKASPGQMNIKTPVRPSIGNVSGPATSPKAPKQPSRSSIGNVSGPATSPKAPKQPSRSSIGNVSGPATSPKPASPTSVASSAASSGGKPPKPPEAPKVSGKFAKIGRLAGPASAALDTALSTADERSKGSGWARSLAKGATVAAGGLAGGAAGAIGGGGVGSAALGTAGALVGGAAAGKAFDTVAGANAKERKGMATANRQRQAGSVVKGIGGPTSFSKGKGGTGFMSTGVGNQRKTVQLAKTGIVQRGGQSVAGNLAFKGGKAVYKASPSAQSLAKTSSNPLERVGRSLFAGAYKKSDAANAAKKLATARANDAARNKALGVKFKPGK